MHYFIFSRSGFTEELKAVASQDKALTLVSLEDMFKFVSHKNPPQGCDDLVRGKGFEPSNH